MLVVVVVCNVWCVARKQRRHGVVGESEARVISAQQRSGAVRKLRQTSSDAMH